MATGIVTTANLFDATPAAFFGHTRRRSEMNELAAQMFEAERRPDVILGGGARHMLPAGQLGAQRSDNRNLVAEFQAEGYALVTNATELLALEHKTEKILGLFHSNNMDVYIDKAILRDPEVLRGLDDQPTLWDMTDKAIQALSQNPNGFFLMVEAASVDKQAHPADWHRSAWDMIEFDKAVAVAKEFAANNPDTLIIVTADHAHSLTITGT